MIDNISLYRFFREVADKGSFSAAAKSLFVSQPAVSSAVMQLEAQLDVQLFNRTARGITLTTEGKVLLDYVDRAFDLIERGEDKLRDIKKLAGGVLRVGASDMTLKFFLLDYIERFRAMYPLVRLTVTNAPTPRSLTSLREGEIDFAAVSGPVAESDNIVFREVRKIQDIAVATEKFASAIAKPAPVSELLKYPLIMLESGTSTRQYLDSYIKSEGIKPDTELATSDLILDFARRGMGIAFIVRDFALSDLSGGALREIKLKDPPPPRPMYLCYRGDQPLSAAASHFISLITDGE